MSNPWLENATHEEWSLASSEQIQGIALEKWLPQVDNTSGKVQIEKKKLLVELFHLLKGIINFGEITVFLDAVYLTCVCVCGATGLESMSVTSEPK